MKKRKTPIAFSSSYKNQALGAGIDSTYIPKKWKVFLMASVTPNLTAGSSVGNAKKSNVSGRSITIKKTSKKLGEKNILEKV